MKTTIGFVLKDIAGPLTRRAGTAFGAYLITMGASQDTVTQVVAGMGALVGLAVDLLLSKMERGR